MTNPLTPAEIAELRRMHEAATKGPWKVREYPVPSKYGDTIDRSVITEWDHPQLKGPEVITAQWMTRDKDDEVLRFIQLTVADAALIVAARNALPALVAASERVAQEDQEYAEMDAHTKAMEANETPAEKEANTIRCAAILDGVLFSHELARVIAERNALTDEITALQVSVEKRDGQIDALEAKLAAVRSDRDEAIKERDRAEILKYPVENNKICELESDLKESNAKLAAANAECDRLKNEIRTKLYDDGGPLGLSAIANQCDAALRAAGITVLP